MNLNLSGATRLNIILGDPIAQVRSPGGVTQRLSTARMTACWCQFRSALRNWLLCWP